MKQLCAVGMVLFAITIISISGGCATLVKSADQNVAFSSDPDGALVKIDGIPVGRTPCVVPVRRKGGSKAVQFELAGHKTVITTLEKSFNGWTLGNFLVGGVIGLGVDAITGRSGDFDNSLHVVLEQGYGTVNLDEIEKAAKEEKNDWSTY